MSVCFLVDRPQPVLAEVANILSRRRTVTMTPPGEGPPAADIYLLKARSPAAIDAARSLERRGGTVINSSWSTVRCLDRVRVGAELAAAGLRTPRALTAPRLDGLVHDPDALDPLEFPVVVKSRYSRRGDLVERVDGARDLRALAGRWGLEPVIVQELVPSDGWDTKLWAIGARLFAARRPSALLGPPRARDVPVPAAELPAQERAIARAAGTRFNLQLFGLDVLRTAAGPVVVDVNPFPGYRSAPGAAGALASFIEAAARTMRGGR